MKKQRNILVKLFSTFTKRLLTYVPSCLLPPATANCRLPLPLLLLLIHQPAQTQSLTDSVFLLSTVEIHSELFFSKEEAGMKQTRVDSLILMEKIHTSLSDVLAENTSVFIKEHGRGALASASFRGTAPSHTEVNWNGIRLNSPMSGMVDFSLLPVYLIDDLDLKHGSASIVDRGGGLGGSINIGNHINWQDKTNIRYMQGLGSYNTCEEFLDVGLGNEIFQSRTRIYHNYSKNNYTFTNRRIGEPDPENGEIIYPLDTNQHAGYTLYGILQEFYYRPITDNVLSLKWWYQDADRSIPRATSFEGPDMDNLNRQEDKDHRLLLDWKHYRKKGKVYVRTAYTRKKLDYSLRNQVPGLGLIPLVNSESMMNSFLNAVSYDYRFDHQLKIQGKLDVDHYAVDTRDKISKEGYAENQTRISLLLALYKNYWERLNLSLMLRQSWTGPEDYQFIPYLGFDILLSKTEKLKLKGNIARNYHQPALNDLYWQPGGNLDLKAESGISTELGLEYKKALDRHQLKAEVTAYASEIKNWIMWIPSYKGYWEARNIREVSADGIEFSLSLQGKVHGINYRLMGNYAYTRSVNKGDPLNWGDESIGKQLPYVPLHSGNALISLSWRGYTLSWQNNSYSERFTTSSNDVSRRDWLYPYYMNNLSMGKEFDIRKVDIALRLSIYNLFNESYHSVLYRPMPGRNYMLILMIKI